MKKINFHMLASLLIPFFSLASEPPEKMLEKIDNFHAELVNLSIKTGAFQTPYMPRFSHKNKIISEMIICNGADNGFGYATIVFDCTKNIFSYSDEVDTLTYASPKLDRLVQDVCEFRVDTYNRLYGKYFRVGV